MFKASSSLYIDDTVQILLSLMGSTLISEEAKSLTARLEIKLRDFGRFIQNISETVLFSEIEFKINMFKHALRELNNVISNIAYYQFVLEKL